MLADYVLSVEEELECTTTAIFKKLLQGLHSQLGRYFLELDTGFQCIRNPRQTDNLVDIVSHEEHFQRKKA